MDEYISKTKFEELMRKKARSNFDLYYADKSKHYLDKAIGYGVAADEAHDFPSEDVQPVNQWISVKDRLPKTGESVLVYIAINKNLKGFGERKPEIRIGWLDDGDKWALQFSNMKYSEVLCWMSLPEPPKGSDIEEHTEVNSPDGNCLDCEFQYLEDSDYWCSVCPGNPEDI